MYAYICRDGCDVVFVSLDKSLAYKFASKFNLSILTIPLDRGKHFVFQNIYTAEFINGKLIDLKETNYIDKLWKIFPIGFEIRSTENGISILFTAEEQTAKSKAYEIYADSKEFIEDGKLIKGIINIVGNKV